MGSLAELLSSPQQVLLVGMGVTNRAVAGALMRRDHRVVAIDDQPDDALREAAADLGVVLVEGPIADLEAQVGDAGLVIPTPGLPESHPVFAVAAALSVPSVSELDLAAVWDDRPIAAVTGTNGKTTVVELAVDALARSGVAAVAAGNTDVPLVVAIDDADSEVFVVEASSFRLARTLEFAPRVGTWLNFAPDHLDVHADLDSYELAKARLWAHLPADGLAVANALDDVVMAHTPKHRRVETFGGPSADWRLVGDKLVGPQGVVTTVDRLWRALPHDIDDVLAAAATVTPVGATLDAIAEAAEHFSGLAHRVSPVGEINGSTFYDDSKATTPHATLAALRGFRHVVLIVGGRSKGIDLGELRQGAERVAAVVAIGEAADEIIAVFGSTHRVERVDDMDEAVAAALVLSAGRLPVLLSPACASFDRYSSYRERGDDFARAVHELGGGTP